MTKTKRQPQQPPQWWLNLIDDAYRASEFDTREAVSWLTTLYPQLADPRGVTWWRVSTLLNRRDRTLIGIKTFALITGISMVLIAPPMIAVAGGHAGMWLSATLAAVIGGIIATVTATIGTPRPHQIKPIQLRRRADGKFSPIWFAVAPAAIGLTPILGITAITKGWQATAAWGVFILGIVVLAGPVLFRVVPAYDPNPDQPRDQALRDRNAARFFTTWTLIMTVPVALVLLWSFTTFQIFDPPPNTFAEGTLIVMAFAGLYLAVMFVVAPQCKARLAFLVATTTLNARHALPPDLFTFMDDAVQRGLIEQSAGTWRLIPPPHDGPSHSDTPRNNTEHQ